jgi:cell division protein FtsB
VNEISKETFEADLDEIKKLLVNLTKENKALCDSLTKENEALQDSRMSMKEEIKALKSRISESNSHPYLTSVSDNKIRLGNISNNKNNNGQYGIGITN